MGATREKMIEFLNHYNNLSPLAVFVWTIFLFSTTTWGAAPVGHNDNLTTGINQTLEIPVSQILSNDTDADGDTLSVLFVDDYMNGWVTFNQSEGTLIFEPDHNFSGQAQFTYILSDIGPTHDWNHLSYAFVYISVQGEGTNSTPSAIDDNFNTDYETSINILYSDLLLNDQDQDGDELEIVSATHGSHGNTLIDDLQNVVIYTPNPGFSGQDQFSYTMSDGAAEATANVIIQVAPEPEPEPEPNPNQPNSAPVGQNDYLTMNSDSTLEIPVSQILGNDVDVDDDTLSVLFIDDYINGWAQYVPGSSVISFTPNAGFTGQAQFTYIVSDAGVTGDWDHLGFAFVYIDVQNSSEPQNLPPIANSDQLDVNEATSIEIDPADLLANDSDPENQNLNIVSVSNLAGGVVEMNGDSIEFFPGAGVTQSQFSYSISDGVNTVTGQVTLNITQFSQVTINQGVGSGFYEVGSTINISSNTPTQGFVFSQWTGDIQSIGNPEESSTTLVVPSSDISLSAVYTSAEQDLTPPSVPAQIVISNVTPNSAYIDWADSTDNVSVLQYSIELNGTIIETQSAESEFTLSGLQASTEYQVRVRATDAAGNASVYSNLRLFRTLDSASNEIRAFYFGHSLVVHNPVDHNLLDWTYFFGQNNGKSFSADGRYGFLSTYTSELPVNPEQLWYVSQTPYNWSDHGTSFADVGYDAIVVTTANFIQNYRAPDEPHWLDGEATGNTTVDHMLTLYDYSQAEAPGSQFYIYSHWPEYQNFPPSDSEQAAFIEETQGSFYQWYVTLQNQVNAQRPGANVKMIPAGYVIAGLLRDLPALAAIPVTELYEDNAPHGEPVIYFLTGLIHYMVLYNEMPNGNVAVPAAIHQNVRDNLPEIIAYSWNQLLSLGAVTGSAAPEEGGQ